MSETQTKTTNMYRYVCEWNRRRNGLIHSTVRRTLYAANETRAAERFIEYLYDTHGDSIGPITPGDVNVRLSPFDSREEYEMPLIGADLAEVGQDETLCNYCAQEARSQDKATSEPIKDDELAAAYGKLSETWQKILAATNTEDEEEEEPEGCYLSISLSRPGRPLLNFHSILEDGGDEDELIGLGIQHLRAVLEFDRDKAKERGRAAAIAANFYAFTGTN